MATTKLEKYAEELVEKVLEGEMSIDVALDDLNRRLEVFDRVKVHRDRLLSARRALLGVGSRTTGNAGNRVTSDEVAQALSSFDDGATVSMLTEKVPGSNDGQVRGHLNRGNGERFLKRKSDNHWFLRDPEEGIDTEEDLPDGD